VDFLFARVKEDKPIWAECVVSKAEAFNKRDGEREKGRGGG